VQHDSPPQDPADHLPLALSTLYVSTIAGYSSNRAAATCPSDFHTTLKEKLQIDLVRWLFLTLAQHSGGVQAGLLGAAWQV
jgi:hypothetical protein